VNRHGATVIGAIQQESLEDVGVAGNETAISRFSVSSGTSAPVGLPGEQRNRIWQRCQTSVGTASKSGLKPFSARQGR